MASQLPEQSFADDERGLSEVLGYIIVFSIVITSIVVVVVGGIATVEDARDSERVENADRAFDVAADNFADIYERNAPSRATEIDLGEASIFYDNNVSMTVSGTAAGQGTVFETTHEFRPVTMRVTDDRNLIYEGGAVFRGEAGNEIMSRDPPFLLEDRVHIPVVKTVAPTIESAGRTTVLLRGVADERELRADAEVDRVTIEISSPRYEAWATGLESDVVDCDTDSATRTVTCELSGNDIQTYVTKHQIELSLIL